MARINKGQLTASPEWAKHLRKAGKRQYWRRERLAEAQLVRSDASETKGDPDQGSPKRIASDPERT